MGNNEFFDKLGDSSILDELDEVVAVLNASNKPLPDFGIQMKLKGKDLQSFNSTVITENI